MKTIILSTLFSLLPTLACAYTYDTSHLPYSDAPTDRSTAVAVSLLTEQGIVEGNPDGTFASSRTLNRAEYVKIVMGLADTADMAFTLNCFPDVPSGIWYELPVCKARAAGYVRGNVIDGVPPEQWLFAPERPVQYEEAVKVLVEIFGLDIPELKDGEQWYVPYITVANTFKISVNSQPGLQITRGTMARLVANFMAHDAGELSQLRSAEALQSSTSSVPSSTSSSVSSISSSSVGTTTPPPAPPSATLDPDTDVSSGPNFLLLGTTASVLGGANIMSDTEPIRITDFVVKLLSAATSVDSFRIFDHDARLLGTAYLDSADTNNRTYRMNVKNKEIVIPKDDDYSYYARAVMRHHDSGGTGGQDIRLEKMGIEGTGEWSQRTYSQYTSETFSDFESARSMITSITNGGEQNAVLISGPGQPIGSFVFTGKTGDSSADLHVTDIVFQIEQAGSVTLSSVQLTSKADSSQRFNCSNTSSQITCSSIPESFGSFDDGPRTLQLYADIAIPNGTQNPSLRLSINNPGTISSAGDITWTDGSTSFTWVQFAQPAARSTYYSS